MHLLFICKQHMLSVQKIKSYEITSIMNWLLLFSKCARKTLCASAFFISIRNRTHPRQPSCVYMVSRGSERERESDRDDININNQIDFDFRWKLLYMWLWINKQNLFDNTDELRTIETCFA